MIRINVKGDTVRFKVDDSEQVPLSVERAKIVGGTFDHSKLINRDAADQHPMSAITGLEEALGGKQPSGAYLTNETDPTVPAWAKQETKPSYTAEEVGALSANELSGAVNLALKQAKDSGEFDGPAGPAGPAGKDGYTPVKGVDYYTEAEKAELVQETVGSLQSEVWTFELEDGSTVTKTVVIG